MMESESIALPLGDSPLLSYFICISILWLKGTGYELMHKKLCGSIPLLEASHGMESSVLREVRIPYPY